MLIALHSMAAFETAKTWRGKAKIRFIAQLLGMFVLRDLTRPLKHKEALHLDPNYCPAEVLLVRSLDTSATIFMLSLRGTAMVPSGPTSRLIFGRFFRLLAFTSIRTTVSSAHTPIATHLRFIINRHLNRHVLYKNDSAPCLTKAPRRKGRSRGFCVSQHLNNIFAA